MFPSLFLESGTAETVIKGTFRPCGPVIPLAAEIEFVARGSLSSCFVNDETSIVAQFLAHRRRVAPYELFTATLVKLRFFLNRIGGANSRGVDTRGVSASSWADRKQSKTVLGTTGVLGAWKCLDFKQISLAVHIASSQSLLHVISVAAA